MIMMWNKDIEKWHFLLYVDIVSTGKTTVWFYFLCTYLVNNLHVCVFVGLLDLSVNLCLTRALVFVFNRGYVSGFTQVIGDTPPNGDIPNF